MERDALIVKDEADLQRTKTHFASAKTHRLALTKGYSAEKLI
jgi:hypothetical protein